MSGQPQRLIRIEEEETLAAATERARQICRDVYGPECEARLAQAMATFRNGFPSLDALYLVEEKVPAGRMSRSGGNLPG